MLPGEVHNTSPSLPSTPHCCPLPSLFEPSVRPRPSFSNVAAVLSALLPAPNLMDDGRTDADVRNSRKAGGGCCGRRRPTQTERRTSGPTSTTTLCCAGRWPLPHLNWLDCCHALWQRVAFGADDCSAAYGGGDVDDGLTEESRRRELFPPPHAVFVIHYSSPRSDGRTLLRCIGECGLREGGGRSPSLLVSPSPVASLLFFPCTVACAHAIVRKWRTDGRSE